jgi:type IV secretory pathway VirB6-like protein
MIYQESGSSGDYRADYSSYRQSGSSQAVDLSSQFIIDKNADVNGRVALLNSYFSTRGIPVDSGDTVNLVIASQLPSSIKATSTNPGWLDITTSDVANQIFNIDSVTFCSNYVKNCKSDGSSTSAAVCAARTSSCSSGKYQVSTSDMPGIFLSFMPANLSLNSINQCSTFNPTYCYQNNGAGMQIAIDDTPIKAEKDQFVGLNNSKYVYTFVAASGGGLKFSSPSISSQPAFTNFNPNLSQNPGMSYAKDAATQNPNPPIYVNQFQSGGYIMEVSVGKSNVPQILSGIKHEYLILPSGEFPGVSDAGTTAAVGNIPAASSGIVWVRARSDTKNITGNINVKATSYTGKQVISVGIYNYIVQPIIQRYHDMASIIYNGLIIALKNYILMVSTLYVLFYAIYFLLGGIQITVADLFSRIIKIVIVTSVLLSGNSWEFFNEYLFSMFFNGTKQLINVFTSVTSDVDNPFGFLDPIFDTYTSPNFWISIIVQLCQPWTGMGFLAMLTIAGVTIFLGALLEVVATYVLSFILISILIGLAPLFIPMILFDYTSEFFKNWLTMLFKAMLQPVIMIFLILIFDDLMKNILSSTIVSSEWGCLKSLDIEFNVAGYNIDLTKDTFCLPFYIPVMDTSPDASSYVVSGLSNYARNYLNLTIASFMYFTYSLVVAQLVSITNNILGGITGLTSDTAVAGGVGGIKKSGIGRAYDGLTGKDFVNKRIAGRSPMLSQAYADPINDRLKISGKLLNKLPSINAATESIQAAASYLGGDSEAAKLHGSKAYNSTRAALYPLTVPVGMVGYGILKSSSMVAKKFNPNSQFLDKAASASWKFGGVPKIYEGVKQGGANFSSAIVDTAKFSLQAGYDVTAKIGAGVKSVASSVVEGGRFVSKAPYKIYTTFIRK